MNKLVITTAALFVVLTFQAHAADSKEEKTASGIGITTLKEGTGANPKVSDTVKVHYRGTLENGQEFDSSYTVSYTHLDVYKRQVLSPVPTAVPPTASG